MTKLSSIFAAALAASLALLAGCSTLDSRIEENQALFASLDPATQAKLRERTVEVGFTPEMVYIALGRPDTKSEKITAKGSEQTWIYLTYYQEYAGQALTHYRRVAVRNPKTGRVAIFIEPVYTSVYTEESEEKIRVSFVDGKVVSIEQDKTP